MAEGKQKVDVTPTSTVTATVEIVGQTEKALRIKNDRDETAWIPKIWVITKKELSEHTWEIEIEKQNWKDKFPGKPKESLSPRSNHSKGKQKVDLTPTPTVTATVEIVGQTEKAILIKNERGETAWIPKIWVITKKELSEHTWEIEIEKQNWKDKFTGKPKESLSPRSNNSKGTQKADLAPIPTVTATVEIVRQTEKAILIKNDRGETAWIPNVWVIKKKVIGEHTWQIVISKNQWEEKFPGKPKESLSPRSNYSKGKQKADLTHTPTVTATVEIVHQTKKAIKIKNDLGKTAWIPRYWLIKKKELSKHTWQIEIKKQQWEEKFPGKPK